MSSRRVTTGATRVVGIIGDPVGHSRSPAMHNAAFDALGLDWVYVPFPVARGEGAAAVRAAATLGLAGLNVTMPHKADAATACEDLSSEAAALGAVNTVVNARGTVVGHSTDGEGFLRALDDEGITVAGERAVVLGAGDHPRARARRCRGHGHRAPAGGGPQRGVVSARRDRRRSRRAGRRTLRRGGQRDAARDER